VALRLVQKPSSEDYETRPSRFEMERKRHSELPKGVHVWVTVLHADERIVVKCARCDHRKTIIVGELPSEIAQCEGEP